MYHNVPLAAGRKRVFDSVFPPSALTYNSPTPDVTPVIGFTAPGEPFGGVAARPSREELHTSPPPSLDSEVTPEQVAWDRAWHNATAYLSLPDLGFQVGHDDWGDDNVQYDDRDAVVKRWTKDPPAPHVVGSLRYVGADSSRARALRADSKDYDLVEWYMHEMRRHFLRNFRDTLAKELINSGTNSSGSLQRLTRCLLIAQRVYFTPFAEYIIPLKETVESQKEASIVIRQNFHSIVRYSLPSANISRAITEELTAQCMVVLGISFESDVDGGSRIPGPLLRKDGDQVDGMEIDQMNQSSYKIWKDEQSSIRRISVLTETEDLCISEARENLLHLLHGLQDVGLGGSKCQKIFAEVMNKMMTEFVTATYSGQWESPSLINEHLRQWTENIFARLVVQVLHVLEIPQRDSNSTDRLDVTLGDVKRWQEIGIARLGALRINELFDIVVEWDSSGGAIEDLKHYVTNPATRFYLTSTFTAMLLQRLLQPGASTTEILQLYISIIRAFTALDPTGVLLDRVARPVRRYLRERDDTVRLIVSGLLADSFDGSGDGQHASSGRETLAELSVELSKAHEQALHDDAGELDWDDMNWMPDPIDAAPDYKKSKDSDVIGSLISLFETKEAFARELQKVLADRLLKKQGDYDIEISVLELLKLRFGDSSLQPCEVMLRDILDSKRIDNVIRASNSKLSAKVDANTPSSSAKPPGLERQALELHAKILSRLFWPSLHDQSFKVPHEILELQETYATGFETLKQCRKLTWLHGLGQVTVELDLEDRVFRDEVNPWQATVIYAFESDNVSRTPSSSVTPVTKTVTELASQLEMSPSLVRAACLFWVSRRILTQLSPDTFQVLEVLSDVDVEHELSSLSSVQKSTDYNITATSTPSGAEQQQVGPPIPSTAENTDSSAVAAESEAATMAKMDLYWQFIVGMLTNQGSMPLQKIIMMLKFAVPGGFPYSSEELREFLGLMVSRGKLEVLSGGLYKMVK